MEPLCVYWPPTGNTTYWPYEIRPGVWVNNHHDYPLGFFKARFRSTSAPRP